MYIIAKFIFKNIHIKHSIDKRNTHEHLTKQCGYNDPNIASTIVPATSNKNITIFTNKPRFSISIPHQLSYIKVRQNPSASSSSSSCSSRNSQLSCRDQSGTLPPKHCSIKSREIGARSADTRGRTVRHKG